jgi:CMP-N,N'-diacetyllegionaminic acid synthase
MTGRVLAVVPARSGSKEIQNKNLRNLAGRPLLAYTVDALRGSGCVDRAILTTDSEEIAELGRRLGLEVPFLRPSELAADDTPMQPVIEHAVAQVEQDGWRPDVIVLLQPTAPLRRGEHIRRAVEVLVETGSSSVVSVVEIPRHYAPEYAMRVKDGRLLPYLAESQHVTRRQDVKPAYSRDGTVYAVRRDVLMEEHDLYGTDCRALILEHQESINLDTLSDWDLAERQLSS